MFCLKLSCRFICLLTLLHLTEKLLIEVFFFQKIIAPNRPSSSKKKKHVLGQWTCFSPFAKKSVKESSLDRTASSERMHMESPKECTGDS